MADGYGLLSLFNSISDNPDYEKLSQLRRMTFSQKVCMYLSVPYHLLMITARFALYPNDRNVLTPNRPANGMKKGYFAKEYKV